MIILKAGGARTVVEVDEANEICMRFTDDLTRFGECHTLDLSCRAWRIESLKVLHPILIQVKTTLRVLLVNDIIASLSTEVGLACFEYLAGIFFDAPLLTRFHLDDNAIGSRGIKVLHPLLTNSSVTSLSFENCGLAEDDAAILKDILTAEGAGRTLLELSLSRNQMGVVGAFHIGEILESETAMGLQQFRYAGSRPQLKGTKALCQGLAKIAHRCGPAGTKLQCLDLDDCCIGSGENNDDDPIANLCFLLQNSPRIQELILRDGELQVSGLTKVINALIVSGAPLTLLDLGIVGELGQDGGQIIRDFLFSNCPASFSLQELYLDTNELGDEGVTEIVAGIATSCRSLRVLDLSGNDLINIPALLLHNHIPTLQTLKLEENSDLVAGKELQSLRGMYREVLMDEIFNDNGEEDNDEIVDDLDNSAAAVDNDGEAVDNAGTSVDALADMLVVTQIK